jgi:tetratricopeptide (TPR) repeat protein
MAEISLQKYYGQIEGMIDQGRYAQAVAHGKYILGTYPKYVAGYRLLGRAMLEARRDEDALDMFLRVLSADPEDMLSWVAMSEIYDRRDELDAAVWFLERAFELSVDNQLVAEELRQLYGRRDGVEPERVELTRGALARLYLKGDLLSRSVSEFRTLLDEQPDRVDLEVAFAEALWRNEQRLEASEVCQRILDKLPYCLKANLLLGEIWVNSGREEGQTYLRRAEALDPQNGMAQALFGETSPLPTRDVRIAPYDERKPVTEEERPAWMTEVEAASVEGPPLTEGEAALVDIAAALEAQIEIPSWLEEIDVKETEAPEVPAFMAAAEEPAEVEEPTLAPEPEEEETPEWLAGVGEDLGKLVQAEEVEQEGAVSEQVPDWMAEVGAEPAGEWEEALGEEQVPDFLSEISAGAFAEEAAPSEGQAPDWLAGLREQAVEVEEPSPVQPAPAEIPDWMQELAPSAEEMPEAEGPALPFEEPAPSEIEGAFGWTAFGETEAGVPEELAPGEEEASPQWLAGEEMPSGEEALAWLEQLAAGKEEELQAQVEAEVEARTAEIMGRPKAEEPVAKEAMEEVPPAPAPAEIPDWVQELAPSAEEVSAVEEPVPSEVGGVAPPEAAVAPALSAEEMPEAEGPALPFEEPAPSEIEGAFGWTAFGETEAGVPEELAPGEEEAPPPWLAGEGMPSGEEALAWLEQLAAGKEEELQAQVEAEVEARTAEIMGRPKAEKPAAERAVEEKAPTPTAEPAPPAEEPVLSEVEGAFGWTAFGEPEVGVSEEFAPGAEEAAPVMEAELAPAAEPEVPSVPSIEEPTGGEAEGAFGWTVFGEPEVFAPSAEGMAEVERAVPEPAALEPEEAIPQALVVGEEPPPSVVEEVMAEAVSAPMVEEMVPGEVEEVVVPSVEQPEAPLVAEIPVEGAPVPAALPVEIAEPAVRAAPPVEAVPPKPKPPAVEPADPFAVEKAYLKENPRDYGARLNLARALWQAGRRREALEAYSRLVRAGKELDVVTAELEEYLEQWPDVSTQRVLGDAYMKSDQLEKALALYRQALESL